MKRSFQQSILAMVAVALMLIGCGGGGGGDPVGGGGGGGGTPPPPSTSFARVDLPELAPTSTFSAAVAINSSGRTVGVSEDAGANIKAVAWTVDQVAGTAGNQTLLPPLAGNNFSAAHGINEGGIVAGRSQSGLQTVPVVWDTSLPSPLAQPLNTFAANTSGAAYSINNRLQMVGEAQIAANGASHATLWNSGGAAPRDLGTLLGGTSSAAYHISNAGVIVGESDFGSGKSVAVRWAVDAAGAILSGPTVLAVLNATDLGSVALGVNTAGEIVGEVELANGEIRAVRWDPTGATITSMGTAGFDSSVSAINTGGDIAGWNTDAGVDLAARYDALAPGFDRVLDDQATFSQLYGLNDNGTMVGIGGAQPQALAIVPR
jgi:uncharacterized membrane protein